MKEIHARTHGFILQVSRGKYLFADCLPIDDFKRMYVTDIPERMGDLSNLIKDALGKSGGNREDILLRFETSDFVEACFALETLRQEELISFHDSIKAYLLFSERFDFMEIYKK